MLETNAETTQFVNYSFFARKNYLVDCGDSASHTYAGTRKVRFFFLCFTKVFVHLYKNIFTKLAASPELI